VREYQVPFDFYAAGTCIRFYYKPRRYLVLADRPALEGFIVG